MSMKTPITYYGGKQLLASTIIGMMPAHKVYCEPYFGGGAVFFAKGRSYCEVINDINDRLITFYEVCQDEKLFAELMDRVQHTLDSERYYKTACLWWNDPTRCYGNKVELAWAVWVVTNMSFFGSPAGGWIWENGTSGSHSGVVIDGYRNQFTRKVHDRLKYVQISCRDALKVIAQRDSADTFFFLDPPYPGTEQKHYDGFSFDDLERLLQLLTTIKGKFLLCNYPSDLLERYVTENSWNSKTLDMAVRVANRATGGRKRKQELMVYNYNIYKTLF